MCIRDRLSDHLVSTNGLEYWYGGGFGYVLSRRASGVVAENYERMKSFLYEDLGVGSILKEELNIECDESVGFSVFEFDKLNILELPEDLVLVTDIPDIDCLWKIHTGMGARVRVFSGAEDFEVDTDWYRPISVDPESSDCSSENIQKAVVS